MSSGFHRTSAWIAFARRMRPILERQLPSPCVQRRCQRGGIVHPGQAFDVAHLIDVDLAPELALDPGNVGPAHPRCNRSDGGRMGAAKTNRARRTGVRSRERVQW